VWSYISTNLYVCTAWCLVKHRNNSTFTFTCNKTERHSPVSSKDILLLWLWWTFRFNNNWELLISCHRKNPHHVARTNFWVRYCP